MVDRLALHTPEVEAFTDALFAQIMVVMGIKRPNWISRLVFLILKRTSQTHVQIAGRAGQEYRPRWLEFSD